MSILVFGEDYPSTICLRGSAARARSRDDRGRLTTRSARTKSESRRG